MGVASPDPRDERIAELERIVAEQARTIERLERLVRELTAKLGNNSRNSNKPPSTDPKPRRKKTGSKLKRGGQLGHTGVTRGLVDDPDAIVPVLPPQCSCCGKRLSGRDLAPQREQVIELPEIHPHVTEYQLHALTCRCGVTTRAQLPVHIRGGYGPRLCALVAHLTGALRLSKRSTSQLMWDLLGVPMAEGTVCKVEQRVACALAPAHAEAVAAVQSASLVHADETGWREDKQRAWLWVFATVSISLFAIARTRGRSVVEQTLGPTFAGFLVSDRWGPYKHVDVRRRQLCWAHLLRDFNWMLERSTGDTVEHIEALQANAEEIFHHWHRLRNGELTRRGFQRRVTNLRYRVEDELAWLRAYACKGVAGKAKEILNLKAALWTFVDNVGIEPTNNHAEQQVRHAVIWRKCSYGTDTAAGSRYVERVLTVVQTARKQKRNPFELLTAYVTAWFHETPPPRLAAA